jgi:glutathione S-transferase
MLMWAGKNQVPVPSSLSAYSERLTARPAVRLSLEYEGLAQPVS